MNINVTKPTGVICKTQGKYCAEDITVVPVLEEKSATPTESAQEIVPSAGNCGISKLNLGAIQAYQGTATPAQGEQTINPTSGKFFSSFKVGAIPSDYVIPSGTEQITANGVYDVSTKANVNVNVPSSGGVEEVATAAAMDALLVEANVGKYYKFTGTTDSNYTNGDLYLVEGGASSETWLLDNSLIDTTGELGFSVSVNFTSNSTTFTRINLLLRTGRDGVQLNYGTTDVYDSIMGSGWTDQAYRTITFDSPVTDTELLTWLQANGTKQ